MQITHYGLVPLLGLSGKVFIHIDYSICVKALPDESNRAKQAVVSF